jgi:hypothetical protein
MSCDRSGQRVPSELMSELDPAAVDAIRMIASAGVGALAGGLVGEWRARAAEKRADKREAERRRRDDWHRALDDTRADYLGSMDALFALLVGSRELMAQARHGDTAFPRANFYLIADEDLMRRVDALRSELSHRPPGSGITNEDMARIGAQRGHVSAALDVQRHRVESGEEPLWPTSAFVREMIDRVGDSYGVPPEYRPKVKDD